MTIDDSPSEDFLRKIDFLHKKNIPAVFFCTGDAIRSSFESVKTAIRHGFYIGNHTTHHYHLSSRSVRECYAEIGETDSLIAKAYKSCGISDYPKLIRYPYGDKGDFKYGYHHFPFSQAFSKGIGKVQSAYLRVMQTLSPDRYLRYLHGREKKGQDRHALLEKYLHNLGYSGFTGKDVGYAFYEKYKSDLDWLWTLDIGDWKYKKNTNQDAFLMAIFKKLDTGKPVVEFAPVEDLDREANTNNADIVLSHDHSGTSFVFYSVIDYMLKKNYNFSDPFC